MNGEWVTIGVHDGHDSKEGKACGALITDDVYLNFILPVIDRFTHEFGKSKRGDPTRAKAYGKKIAERLEASEEDMKVKPREDEKEAIKVETED